MPSILLLALGVGVATALLISMTFHFLTPSDNSILSPLEQHCQQIANEGYKIHSVYPDSNPDDLPADDLKRLLYLDDLWIKECVSALPADSIFSIINNVERDFPYGE